MRLARQLHLYFGVFFAPSIIFFAFTGFLQTYSWHEGANAQRWIVALENVHTHQRMPPQPAATPAPPAAAPAAASTPAPSTSLAAATTGAAQANQAVPARPAPPRRKRSAPLRAFMGFMAVGLIGSSLVGIWMGYQLRQPGVVSALLFAGTLIPIVAFYVGTRQ